MNSKSSGALDGRGILSRSSMHRRLRLLTLPPLPPPCRRPGPFPPLLVALPQKPPPLPSSRCCISRALRYDDEEKNEFPAAPIASSRAVSSSTSFDDDEDEDEGDEEEGEEEEALILASEGMDLLYGIAEDDGDDDDDEEDDDETGTQRRGGGTAAAAAETARSSPSSPSSLPPSPAEGGDQRLFVDAVIAAGSPTHPKTAAAMFPHPLDRFQRRALRASLAGRDVVVCAPTGAGKTAIAAAAALGVLASGRRVVYTTPLKALSNQKLSELRELFGGHRVGLQTGDATINPGAPVVVMTTEVLRNILLRVESSKAGTGASTSGSGGEKKEEKGGGEGEEAAAAALLAAAVTAAAVASSDSEAETSSSSAAAAAAPLPPPSSPSTTIPVPATPTADVGLIVLDEVHYLGDPSRGTTWEEVIMSCPAGASLLAMSATVRNPGDLGAWIGAVHGKRGGKVGGGGDEGGGVAVSVDAAGASSPAAGAAAAAVATTPAVATAETIVTSARPVPLTWMYAWSSPPWLRQQEEERGGGNGSGGGFGSEEDEEGIGGGKRQNAEKLPAVRLVDLLAPLPPGVVGPGGSGASSNSGASSSSSSSQRPARLRLSAALRPRPRGGGNGGGGGAEPKVQPAPVPLARELERRGFLPAIWFVFSRAGCDATATTIGRSREGGGGDESGKRGKGKAAAKPSAATDIGSCNAAAADDVGNSSSVQVGGGPSPEKLAEIDRALAELSRDQPEAVRAEMVPALRAGIASHHAGCLPGWKQLVERLFQNGCLDVVVATETLAAGINMPARTTVISSLSRRRGPRGVEPLTHNELLQMAGRAGRRGFDAEGACVLLHDGSSQIFPSGGGWGLSPQSSSPAAAAALLARGPERLSSRFRPSYSMALNLLASRPLSEAREFVERSFGSWLRGEGARARGMRLDAAERAAAEAREAARELQRRAAEEATEARAKVEAALPSSSSSFDGALSSSESSSSSPSPFPTPSSTDAAASKKAAKRSLRAAIKKAVARRAARAAEEAQQRQVVPASAAEALDPSSSSSPSSFELFAAPWTLAVDLSASDASGDEAVPALAVGIDWAPKEALGSAAGNIEGSGSGSENDDDDDVGKLASTSFSSANSAFVAVPRTREAGEPRGELLCLLADNMIARIQFAHVAGVEAAAVDESEDASVAPLLSSSAPPPPSSPLLAQAVLAAEAEASATGAWKGVPGGALAASGTALTAEAAAALAGRGGGVARDDGDDDDDEVKPSSSSSSSSFSPAISLFLPSAADELEMRSARSAVREARAAARKERREAQRAGTSVKKQRRAREAAALKQRQQQSRLSAAAAAAWAEADSASRTAAAMQAALEEDLSATWRSFEAVVAVLESVGAVERGGGGGEEENGDGDRQRHQWRQQQRRGGGKAKKQSLSLDDQGSSSPPPLQLTLSPLGEVARGLAGENELWLATLLTHGAVQSLTPSELAAALSAVAAGESTLRPGASAPYPPSRAVLSAVAAMEPARARLARAQAAAGVDSPLALDLRLAGVVEAWASSAEWKQAAGDAAGMDAGDVARLMQRTVDLLRQAGGCQALPPGIRRDARRAAAKMYRPPISDLVQ